MQITPSGKKFEFENAKPALTSSVNHIIEYVTACAGEANCADDTLFKIKSITTELLTNAYKHAGTKTVQITLNINKNFITVSKADKGKPFDLVNGLINTPGQKKLLAYDAMHNLYAQYHPDGLIYFIAEENHNDCLDITKVAEHFGLLIITKCADEFTYHFEPNTGKNTFVVKVKNW